MTTGMKHLAAYQANLPDYNAAKDRACNYIGNQIRAARKSMKLSLEQLSQILIGYGVDIGRVAVNKWEKGISIPSAYQLLAVCAALHLEDGFDYFVSNTKRPLLNAEGRRKMKEYREDLIASGKYREVPPVLEIRYLDMPVSDLPVSAGTGAFLDEGNFEMVSFPESSIPDGAEFGVRVSGDSMTPSLQDQDVILLWKTGDLKAGDLVGFSWQNKLLLKRVIGLPGDVISIDETGAVTRNGQVLTEPYVDEPALGECSVRFPYQVPENRYFVLGDHRATSIDSRSTVIGCVEKEQLIGKVVVKIWPLPLHFMRTIELG